MFEIIDKYYQQKNIFLPKEELQIISSLATRKTLNKKEFFYKSGDVNAPSAYILKGSMRVFIETNQRQEFNRFFAFEDWWVGEVYQIFNNDPVKANAQALEKTEIIEISKQAHDIIFKTCPVYAKEMLSLALKGYASLLEKEEIKKTMTIEELYLDLTKNSPKILERVPLYHIASYFGVKTESLSRVKKKFKEIV